MSAIDESELVRREIELYVDTSNFSIGDHEEALKCFDFQELLTKGVLAFSAICRLDERFREKVLSDPSKYTPAFDEFVLQLYRLWHSPCESLLQKLEEFEQLGYAVECGDDFRKCCREAVGILTADQEFFNGDALVALRDAALDDHEKGQTSEYAL